MGYELKPKTSKEMFVETSKHSDFPPFMSPRALQGRALTILKTQLIVLQK